mmetsp:Transcript_36684/g.72671  ORF Transcript_36684/g.72671 Transcript_36684/m.72671 type:complete len:126 (+) Transcript_36684:270-647(+)
MSNAWVLTKEEHLEAETTFCSARYYKPLVHKSGYGNQVLSLAPHLVVAKLSRRIFLLEPFHTMHSASKGDEIAFGKLLGKGVRSFACFLFLLCSFPYFSFHFLSHLDRSRRGQQVCRHSGGRRRV